MRVRLDALSVVATVVGTAVLGMVLGGLFGFAAGHVAPDLFTKFILGQRLEPLGTAVVLGASGGTVCGGLLGVFALIVQVAAEAIRRRKGEASAS